MAHAEASLWPSCAATPCAAQSNAAVRATVRIIGASRGVRKLPPRRLGSGYRGRGLFLELQHDLVGFADVDRDLAAVLQLAEEKLVGQRPPDRVLDEARHGTGAHERIEALLRQVL